MALQIASITPPGEFSEVIEVRMPIRFYWDASGFQGIEITFNEELMEWEQEFVKKVFDIFKRET